MGSRRIELQSIRYAAALIIRPSVFEDAAEHADSTAVERRVPKKACCLIHGSFLSESTPETLSADDARDA